MSIRERITAEMKVAMKARDALRLGTLRMIKAEIIKQETEPGASAMDEAALVRLLQSMKKQRMDAIGLYEKGGRQDLADKERGEITILEDFMPAQMDEAELASVVETVVTELGATSMKDMGRVIKAVMARTAGSVDGKRVSTTVKMRLSP